MMNDIVAPLVRRAILDFLEDVGGEFNDDVLALELNALGHRIARRDVRDQLDWLAGCGLIQTEMLGPYVVATILPDGRDVATGRLRVDGVHRHKTGS